jgi:hypothetical protein
MSDLNLLLSHLDGARRITDSRYIAKCPAHDDGDPSLSIRQLPDSRILIKCFAGCGALRRPRICLFRLGRVNAR